MKLLKFYAGYMAGIYAFMLLLAGVFVLFNAGQAGQEMIDSASRLVLPFLVISLIFAVIQFTEGTKREIYGFYLALAVLFAYVTYQAVIYLSN